uniref:Ig-like domain-containing protein n=1 Tax=Flavobacterium sp. UBA7682 TaxID=1946560 RepID=UPI0025C50F6F
MNIKLPLQTVFSLLFGRKLLLHIFFLTASFSVFGQNFKEDFGNSPIATNKLPLGTTTEFGIIGKENWNASDPSAGIPISNCPINQGPNDGGYLILSNVNAKYDGQTGCAQQNTLSFPGWHQNFVDHTTGNGTGNYVQLNGDGTTIGKIAYQKTINVTVNNEYQFSAWIANVLKPGACAAGTEKEVNIAFEIYYGTNVTGTPAFKIESKDIPGFNKLAPATTPAKITDLWQEAFIQFIPKQSQITLVLRDRGGKGCGNDFALDDISFVTCNNSTTSVTITGPTTTLCASPTATAKLTGSPASNSAGNGVWTRKSGTGSIDASGNVTGMTAGTSVFTYTILDVDSCEKGGFADFTLTASASATPSFTYTATCTGATASNISPAGGIFALTSNPDGVASINTSTGVITGGTPGVTYAATYTVAPPCGGVSAAVPVTVLAKDNPAFTLSATCNSATATITGTTGGTFSFTAPAPTDGAIINASTGAISNALPSTTYNVTYTTAGACPDSSNQSIATLAAPTAPAVSNVNYCINAIAVPLTATPTAGGTLRWYTVPTGGTASATAPTPSTNTAGTVSYYVSQVQGGCESPRAKIDVITQNIVAVVPQPATTVIDCGGSPITLNSTGSTALGAGITYQWQRNNADLPGETAATFSASSAGSYTLKVSNTNLTSCEDISDPIVITADKNIPVVSFANPQVLTCDRQSVTINASASTPPPSATVTYIWLNPDNSENKRGNNAAAAQLSVTQAGQYTLRIENAANSCNISKKITVTEDKVQPTIVMGQPSGTLTCSVTSVTVSTTGSSVTDTNTTYEYEWKSSAGAVVGTTETLTTSSADTYTLRITNTTNKCFDEDTVTVISDVTDPKAVIAAPSILTCDSANQTVTLNGTASTTGPDIVYQWTTTDGNILSGANTNVAVVNRAGTYKLTVTDLTKPDCPAERSVVVKENRVLPTVNIAIPQDITCTRPMVTLDASLSSTGATMTYLWTASNGGVIDSGADTRTPLVSSGGRYTLTITNTATGCPSSDFVD